MLGVLEQTEQKRNVFPMWRAGAGVLFRLCLTLSFKGFKRESIELQAFRFSQPYKLPGTWEVFIIVL